MQSSTETLIAAARALAPLVAEHRAELRRGPDLPQPLADALHAAGLTRLWLPAVYGGPELPPADYIRVIEEVSMLDGAVGWCTAIAAGGARLAGMLPPDTAAEMFRTHRRSICGSVTPSGTATEADGGWRVAGRWSWGSFARHNDYTLGMCRECAPDGSPRMDPAGGPLLRFAIIPATEARFLDTWDAGGLRATGSHDFEIPDVFVPDSRTVGMRSFESEPRIDGPLYGLPFVTTFTLSITPVPLGIARAAIDALVALAARKTATGASGVLREQASTQDAVARAEATLRAARAFVFDAVGEFWEAAQRGAAREIGMRANVRLACWNAAQAGKQVAAMMYDAASGSAVDERLPFAACLRDANAAGQHIAFAQRSLETAGRIFLGIDVGVARF